MDQSDIMKNYHSYIDEIKGTFDPIIKKMRQQKNEKWVGIAWKGPIKQVLGYFKHAKIVSAIKWSSLPLLGQAIVILTGWYKHLPLWSIILGSVVLLFVIYYFFYVKRYIDKMATLGSPEFHVEALKARRPVEYAVWNTFIQKDHFTFNGLYDAFNTLLVPIKDGSIESVLQYSIGREEVLEETIQELRDRIEELERSVDGLAEDIDNSENSISYLVNLLKAVNTNIYRLTNGILDFDDLRFVSPFTIYAVKENKLTKILDKGTSGGSVSEIDLSVFQEFEYAAVSATKAKSNDSFISYPYPGKVVVAFSMKMLNNERWVWCFHFDESDKRALSLVISNDIIESRQIRRLIHAFCLILHKNMISKKEATQDVAEQAN